MQVSRWYFFKGTRMTIAVLWFDEKSNQLCCAADTRISRGISAATDNGPKILPVTVACFEEVSGRRIWLPTQAQSFGFAFSGSSLSAMSAYALATACTQNLNAAPGHKRPVSLAAVAGLFRTVAQHYIVDMSSRTGRCEPQNSFFFKAMVFGFCRVSRGFKAFVIEPSMAGGACQIGMDELPIAADLLHPMGSGAEDFTKLHASRDRRGEDPDPVRTLEEMLTNEIRHDVGGSIQVGVCGQNGFRVLPVLTFGNGVAQPTVSFLGWDVAAAGDVDGYEIGYNAISFD